MIDSGASHHFISGTRHHFISGTLVSQLQLPVAETPLFGVKLGDGYHVQSIGQCRDVSLLIGDLSISVDCFLFPLGGVDIILGITWLETLSIMQVDWKSMEMTFRHQGKLIE